MSQKRVKETPSRRVNKIPAKRLRHAPALPQRNLFQEQFDQFKLSVQQQMENMQTMFQNQMAQNMMPPPLSPSPTSVTNIDVAPSQTSVTNIDVAPSPTSVTNIDVAPSQTSVTNIDVANSENVTEDVVNTAPTYSNLDDLMDQSSDENGENGENDENDENGENGENGPATPPPSRLTTRPGPSRNYYETPVSQSEWSDVESPTSPSLLEYHKKQATIHKNRLTDAEKMNITINVIMNHCFVHGRRIGFRKVKKRKQKQGFKTHSKSDLIKDYYKKFFPDLHNSWGRDFDTICPIKPCDINEWLRNICLYGSIEPGNRSRLPEPPTTEEMDK